MFSGRECSEPWDHDVIDPRLAGCIGLHRAEEAVGDTWFFEQAGQLGGDVRAHVVGRLCDLINQFLAAVDERDDVAEVTAAQEVAGAAAFERFELRGDEVGRRGRAYPCAGWKFACGIAAPCQRFSKPRMPGWGGMASRVSPLG